MKTEYIYCRICGYKTPLFRFSKSTKETKSGWNKMEDHYKHEHPNEWNKIHNSAEKIMNRKLKGLEQIIS